VPSGTLDIARKIANILVAPARPHSCMRFFYSNFQAEWLPSRRAGASLLLEAHLADRGYRISENNPSRQLGE
jgi:hypothetical protein